MAAVPRVAQRSAIAPDKSLIRRSCRWRAECGTPVNETALFGVLVRCGGELLGKSRILV